MLQPPSTAVSAAADVARKLEATHFCYEGNPVLTPANASRLSSKK